MHAHASVGNPKIRPDCPPTLHVVPWRVRPGELILLLRGTSRSNRYRRMVGALSQKGFISTECDMCGPTHPLAKSFYVGDMRTTSLSIEEAVRVVYFKKDAFQESLLEAFSSRGAFF